MQMNGDHNCRLGAIPADRQLIDRLAADRLISKEAREYALDLLYPAKDSGLWFSRLLLLAGSSLVLCGIVYFFAFNWAEIGAFEKFVSIELAAAACVIASYVLGDRETLSGRVLLLSAAVLVGVFLAVFGQVYQTGADSYTLFMTWSVLILPWTILSEFAALWFIWLLVTNAFLVLYCEQTGLWYGNAGMVNCLIAIFNVIFLAAREYLTLRDGQWAEGKWTRFVLVIPILGAVAIPSITFIAEPSRAGFFIKAGLVLSVLVHLVFYIMYRFKRPDMISLSATFLSLCIIGETAAFKVLREIFPGSSALLYLLMGGFTLLLFATAVFMLRRIAAELGGRHG